MILDAVATQSDITLAELRDLLAGPRRERWRCHALAVPRASQDHAQKQSRHAAEQDRPDVLMRRRAWFEGQPARCGFGMTAPMVLDAPMTAEWFLACTEQVLVPTGRPSAAALMPSPQQNAPTTSPQQDIMHTDRKMLYVEDLVRGIMLLIDTVPQRPSSHEEIAAGGSLSPGPRTGWSPSEPSAAPDGRRLAAAMHRSTAIGAAPARRAIGRQRRSGTLRAPHRCGDRGCEDRPAKAP